ncbi:MAG: Crp/Fnr family transcriptional regulator [Bacteroidetes bacterium]|nr:Crp/Fnr family transcriptional regulator [Bacteroidota bacterium]
MDDLLIFLRTLTDFSEESWHILSQIVKKVEYHKGDYLVQADKVCHSLFFISRGYCRAFHIQEGVEVNTMFYFEGEIATNINSYATQVRSSFFIEACEPMTVYRFDKEDVFKISQLSPQIDMAGKRSLERIAAKQEKQLEMFRLLSARKRYDHLAIHQPEMLNRVSLSQLSSYLGVTRETLSRIRSKKRSK